MKKLYSVILCAGILSGIAITSVQAVTPNEERGFITVNTSSEAEITPDVAEISFTVKTSDTKSMQKATASNKEISDKVYAILKALINPASGDYIKTSNFNASPIYTYNGNKKNFDRYEVTNRVTVHTKSTDSVGKMIDSSISAGATNVDSLAFSVSNYDAQCDELISKAAKKAYNRANILAKASNTVITGVNNINTSCGSNNGSYPRLYMAKNMISDLAAGASAEQESGMAISNGVIKINANVNASYFVK